MYLLFISHEQGAHQNTIYPTLEGVREELKSLADILTNDDGWPKQRLLSVKSLQSKIDRDGDYFGKFDDGSWYSIYQLNGFEIKRIKDYLNE